MQERCFIVKKDNTIIKFLIEEGFSKNKVKSLLKYDNILINGKIVSKYNEPVKVNDKVIVTKAKKVRPPFNIIYEDEYFLVINKKSRLLILGENGLYERAKTYLKKKQTNEKLFPINMLDKEASGIVLFSKNKDLALKLQKNWKYLVSKKIYVGVVSSVMKKREDTLEFYMRENGNKNVIITNDSKDRKIITKYKTIKSNQTYSLLSIEAKPDANNQIRATLSYIGHPIIGDKKYYSKVNPISRLALTLTELELKNPLNNQVYSFKINIPKEFIKLCNTKKS